MENEETIQESQPEVEEQEVETPEPVQSKKHSIIKWSVVGVLVLVAGFFITYFFLPCPYCMEVEPETPIACSADAKVCPDGSAVGRVGPNCEFAECPIEVDTVNEVDVVNLQTYTDDELEFTFKYPEGYFLDKTNGVDVYDGRLFSIQILPSFDSLGGIGILAFPGNLAGREEELSDIDWPVINKETISVNGMDWRKIEFAADTNHFGWSTHYLVENEGVVYDISGVDVFIDVLDDLVQTFEFAELIAASEWQTYKNEEFGFEISFPNEWAIDECNWSSGTSIYFREFGVSVGCPQYDGGKDPILSLHIGSYSGTADDYIEEYPETLKNRFDDYNDGILSDIQVDNISAVKITKTVVKEPEIWELGPPPVLGTLLHRVLLINDGYSHSFYFETAPDKEDSKALIEPIINSMKFSENEVDTTDWQSFKFPDNKVDCVSSNGLWYDVSGSSDVFGEDSYDCYLKTTDGGSECSDSSECEGMCLAKDYLDAGSVTTGYCSEYTDSDGYSNHSSWQEVTNGMVDMPPIAY